MLARPKTRPRPPQSAPHPRFGEGRRSGGSVLGKRSVGRTSRQRTFQTAPARVSLYSVLSVVGLFLTTPAAAGAQDQLQLIYSGPIAIVFMDRKTAGSGAAAGGPVEVTHWTFFDPADRLTSTWGWNTRVSRYRVDCQTGQSEPLHHQVFQDDTLVEESRPTVGMRSPSGEDHKAVLNHVCVPSQTPPPQVVVPDVAAARAWAAAAYLAMAGEAPSQLGLNPHNHVTPQERDQ
jgi:hypothetical protein